MPETLVLLQSLFFLASAVAVVRLAIAFEFAILEAWFVYWILPPGSCIATQGRLAGGGDPDLPFIVRRPGTGGAFEDGGAFEYICDLRSAPILVRLRSVDVR